VRASDIVPIHVADFTYPTGHPLAGQPGLVLCFVVRHPGGLVLVDTGFATGHPWIDEHYQPRGRAIRDAIGAAGIDANAVSAVVNTHLHFDHAGQNAAFPDVPIVVQDLEWHAVWEREDHTIREWVDFPNAKYVRVNGDTELAPGLRALATPGHTPGHQSITIETDDGLVLIVGQAAQDARAFATSEADTSLARLRALNAERIHFSHDRAVLKRAAPHAAQN
jgi:glyoxylase-like metal-dependent hydrolase (beta-lactamase superfamily II)